MTCDEKVPPSCGIKDTSYYVYNSFYVIAFITFLIVGILYETGKIHREVFEKKSNGLLGLAGLIIIGIGLIIMTVSLNTLDKSYLKERGYFWVASHFLAYFALTIVCPGQWPFWLCIGILWEYCECYTFCWKKVLSNGKNNSCCTGYIDVLANIAGIAVAMWIRSYLAARGINSLPGIKKWDLKV